MLVLEPMPETERLEVFVLMDVDAVLDRIRGDARCLQPRSQIIRLMTARERTDELIERRGVLDSRSCGGESRVAGVAPQSSRASIATARRSRPRSRSSARRRLRRRIDRRHAAHNAATRCRAARALGRSRNNRSARARDCAARPRTATCRCTGPCRCAGGSRARRAARRWEIAARRNRV